MSLILIRLLLIFFGLSCVLCLYRPWDYEMIRDDPGVGDYDLYDESGYGYANSLLPFLQSHFKPCPSSSDSTDSIENVGNCRPFYMPCKSELACAISCRVNDYTCGKCSETNSFRKVCQCCDSDKSGSTVKRNNFLIAGLSGIFGGNNRHGLPSISNNNKKQSDIVIPRYGGSSQKKSSNEKKQDY